VSDRSYSDREYKLFLHGIDLGALVANGHYSGR
jgi:hypothetical protein